MLSFADLCREFRDYAFRESSEDRGPASDAYQDVLLPRLLETLQALSHLQHYRSRNTPYNPYPVPLEDLFEWYALSRLNDYLLVSYQKSPDFYAANPQWSGDWLSWMASMGAGALTSGNVALITPDQYNDFFLTLGFETFGYLPYHPFHHEIVEIVEDPDWNESPVIEHVFWPGLRFGEMLFSRAGVRLWCAPEAFDKRTAENACLYFTYWRQRRRVEDQSHGWGSNSQWGTAFRRDYESDDAYHFNVDGEHPLDDVVAYQASFSLEAQRRERAQEKELGSDALTLEERIELLVYRSFVRCTKQDENRYPYNDRYSLPKRTH